MLSPEDEKILEIPKLEIKSFSLDNAITRLNILKNLSAHMKGQLERFIKNNRDKSLSLDDDELVVCLENCQVVLQQLHAAYKMQAGKYKDALIIRNIKNEIKRIEVNQAWYSQEKEKGKHIDLTLFMLEQIISYMPNPSLLMDYISASFELFSTENNRPSQNTELSLNKTLTAILSFISASSLLKLGLAAFSLTHIVDFLELLLLEVSEKAKGNYKNLNVSFGTILIFFNILKRLSISPAEESGKAYLRAVTEIKNMAPSNLEVFSQTFWQTPGILRNIAFLGANPQMLLARASSLCNLEDPILARDFFSALAVTTLDTEVWLQNALILLELNQNEEALSYLKVVLWREPKNPTAAFLAALLKENINREENALHDLSALMQSYTQAKLPVPKEVSEYYSSLDIKVAKINNEIQNFVPEQTDNDLSSLVHTIDTTISSIAELITSAEVNSESSSEQLPELYEAIQVTGNCLLDQTEMEITLIEMSESAEKQEEINFEVDISEFVFDKIRSLIQDAKNRDEELFEQLKLNLTCCTYYYFLDNPRLRSDFKTVIKYFFSNAVNVNLLELLFSRIDSISKKQLEEVQKQQINHSKEEVNVNDGEEKKAECNMM